MAKTVISASRRTDLPRFHYAWLQQVLKDGEAAVANPRFPEKIYKVDLEPANVHSLVLWSKDFSRVLADPGYLNNYNLYFQYTINLYSRLLEPCVPSYRESLAVLDGLLKRYCPAQFNIRFDPIIISTRGELCPTIEQPEAARLSAFATLCQDLVTLGMDRCRITTSYLTLYPHVKRGLTEIELDLVPLDTHGQAAFFTRMAEIGAQYGLSIYTCACPAGGAAVGIELGRCIDGYLLEGLFGGKVSKAKDGGQRSDCLCHKSIDIGDYKKQCTGGCEYCYRQNHS
ncbi:MAG: DUF1848 family protein [Negativicutes bacterium]|nr:DUF1848 family protein [Negativicutes bacterium]